MYLGDGCINKGPRAHKLRIFLDNKYPGIIQECQSRLGMVLPKNKVSIYSPGKNHGNCSVVVVYSQLLPEIFPQHGPGMKHLRKIALQDWQEEIIKKYPKDFLRGFIHSDGCRDKNIVNNKSYPRYSFSQKSDDIMKIFQQTCQLLEIEYTVPRKDITAISKRRFVDFMDSFIGPKF